jgi:energy-converting hydrogenase Eha subunit A
MGKIDITNSKPIRMSLTISVWKNNPTMRLGMTTVKGRK